MKPRCFFLMESWRRSANMPEQSHEQVPCLESLRRTEWSPRFETLMRNRLVMGAFRYGLLNAPGKPEYDRIRCIERHLKLYRETKNKEHLVDIANTALLEFEEGEGTFKPIDDGEHHARI